MKRITIFLFIAIVFIFSGCSSFVRFSSQPGNNYSKNKNDASTDYSVVAGQTFRGKASYYADEFNGRQTSSGEIFDMNDFTAAHKTLPFGTIVEVKNLLNGKTVTVKINDRGPFVADRIIDLSKAAAMQIDLIRTGTADVELRIISVPF
ncbi:MAG: septal ring lytic transglycosylase RlpA family protein [FCB group bacterium]|jgi:rare lipoprotein A